jgi:hypothetical protein
MNALGGVLLLAIFYALHYFGVLAMIGAQCVSGATATGALLSDVSTFLQGVSVQLVQSAQVTMDATIAQITSMVSSKEGSTDTVNEGMSTTETIAEEL